MALTVAGTTVIRYADGCVHIDTGAHLSQDEATEVADYLAATAAALEAAQAAIVQEITDATDAAAQGILDAAVLAREAVTEVVV